MKFKKILATMGVMLCLSLIPVSAAKIENTALSASHSNLGIIMLDAGDTNDFTPSSNTGSSGRRSGGGGIFVGGLGGIVVIGALLIYKHFKDDNNNNKPTGGGSGGGKSVDTAKLKNNAKSQLDNFRYNPRASMSMNASLLLSGLASGAVGGIASDLLGDIVGNGNDDEVEESLVDEETMKKIANEIVEFKKIDTGFSEDKFLAHTTDLWTKMQIAWSNNDLNGLSGVESKSLYSTHEAQINELIKSNWFNHIERPIIKSSSIIGIRQDENLQYITIRADTRMIDYVEDADGNIQKGSRTNLITPSYDIEYCRSKNAKTIELDENSNIRCPQCGAPTTIRTAGVCEYCGFVISVADSDWTINKLKRVQN